MINIVKTVAMSFHSKQNRFPIQPKINFRSMDISYISELNLLGTHITKNLKCIAHVSLTNLTLNKLLYLIK
jgi:hypothetical protein